MHINVDSHKSVYTYFPKFYQNSQHRDDFREGEVQKKELDKM